ncbi:2128_t:CDS:2 [Funneliformis geosporum]|nr:2128_t:CDS:2 [Funneliformis geosporum]
MVDSSQEEQYKIQLHLISDISILENQVAGQDRYQFPVFDGKMKMLQDNGLGKILLLKEYFHNALLLAYWGGEYYQLKIIQFDFLKDGRIDFQRFHAKNNQHKL